MRQASFYCKGVARKPDKEPCKWRGKGSYTGKDTHAFSSEVGVR